MSDKFKVGDRVTLAAGFHSRGPATVTNRRLDGMIVIKFDSDGDDRPRSYSEDDLTFLEDVDNSKLEAMKVDFKVGQIVTEREPKWFPEGDRLKVTRVGPQDEVNVVSIEDYGYFTFHSKDLVIQEGASEVYDVSEVDDVVNHPRHYKDALPGGGDLWSLLVHRGLAEAAAESSIFRYIFRFNEKGGTEDLRKAYWYLGKLIGLREEREGK